MFECPPRLESDRGSEVDATTLDISSRPIFYRFHFPGQIGLTQERHFRNKRSVERHHLIGPHDEDFSLHDLLYRFGRSPFRGPHEHLLGNFFEKTPQSLLCPACPEQFEGGTHRNHERQYRSREPFPKKSGRKQRQKSDVIEVPFPFPNPLPRFDTQYPDTSDHRHL